MPTTNKNPLRVVNQDQLDALIAMREQGLSEEDINAEMIKAGKRPIDFTNFTLEGDKAAASGSVLLRGASDEDVRTTVLPNNAAGAAVSGALTGITKVGQGIGEALGLEDSEENRQFFEAKAQQDAQNFPNNPGARLVGEAAGKVAGALGTGAPQLLFKGAATGARAGVSAARSLFANPKAQAAAKAAGRLAGSPAGNTVIGAGTALGSIKLFGDD